MDKRQALRKAFPDVVAGATFIGFGLGFALQALTYDVGTPLRMGPGFFPLLLGATLVVLGLLVVGSGFVAERDEPVGGAPWRGVVLISVAFIFFGLAVRGLGVAPSLFVATLLSALASERVGVLTALVIAAGLTVLSVVIFIVALQLRLPVFGPWLRF